VEVRRGVIVEEHRDHDPVEARDGRHARSFLARSGRLESARCMPIRLALGMQSAHLLARLPVQKPSGLSDFRHCVAARLPQRRICAA
jgi:hypothetical protein